MVKCHKGFTLIEVSLFLALSGVLTIGIIIGTNISVARQRYNDSVNTVVKVFRSAYSDVQNVSINGTDRGRSDKAVYGKLITVGECFTQETPTNFKREVNPNKVCTYDIIGDAITSNTTLSSSAVLAQLNEVGAKIISSTGSTPPQYNFNSATEVSFPWDTKLEKGSGDDFRGFIFVVRSPSTGYIYTFVKSADGFSNCESTCNGSDFENNVFGSLLAQAATGNLVFCVDSPDNNWQNRRGIRINENAFNASGVEFLAQDDTADCNGYARN